MSINIHYDKGNCLATFDTAENFSNLTVKLFPINNQLISKFFQ